ncbi:MAG: amidohydrolase [Bilifractor sp.]
MSKSILIKNAKIWTADKNNPWADAIGICGKYIDFVGREEDTGGTYDEVIDAQGKLLIPGLIDSHTHVGAMATSLWSFLLEPKEYGSMDEVMQEVQKYAQEHPKEEVPYIYAYSCPTELMDAERPDRTFMDQYVTDRPVLLCDANYHRCLVNSRMLELMEIDENTPYNNHDSKNYERYQDGRPNGIIHERVHEFNHDIDRMFDKINWHPPKGSEDGIMKPIMDILQKYGICAVHDGFNETEDPLIGMKKLEADGGLHCHYYAIPLVSKIEDFEDTIRTAKEWKEKYEDEYIHINTIKLFLDGTNELGTGAYIDPMANDPDSRGIMNHTEEEMIMMFTRANQEHLDVQVHLVGDRSFRTSLDAAEKARAAEEKEGREFTSRITLLHCELTHPDDRKRPAQLGLYINFTPIWAAGLFGEGSKVFLGEERFNSMYAFSEMIESGAVVNFSSDLVDGEFLEFLNPFTGVEIGHTRSFPALTGTDIPREPASECLSIEDLMLGYTINNAKGMGIDARMGSLEKGKLATLCILDRDIFTAEADTIHETKVETFMFEGEILG